MTDSGTSRAGADSGGERTPPGPEGSGRPRPRPRWLRWAALGVSVLVLAAAGVAWSLYRQLDGNIDTDVDTAEELERYEAERPPPTGGDAKNILVLGSDDRGNGNGDYGKDFGTQRADTAILLHISADRSRATGVSLPRDLMVDIPRCTRLDDGTRSKERFAQFNSAFETGGPACTIRTVEKLTGVRVGHHLVVDFEGFKKLVDSVGGVDVCLSEDVHDRQAKLDLRAGRQTLNGEHALGYVRARHGLGNGSDTERMGRQQEFLGSLVKKLRSNGVLLNPTKLYPVLDAATSSLTADSGLDSLTELYELVRSVRNIPEGDVRFLTVPRQPYELDINRDELVQPQADKLFARLRSDRAVQVAGHSPDIDDAESLDRTPTGNGSGPPSERPGDADSHPGEGTSESAAPTYPGTTAARDICTSNGAGNGVN